MNRVSRLRPAAATHCLETFPTRSYFRSVCTIPIQPARPAAQHIGKGLMQKIGNLKNKRSLHILAPNNTLAFDAKDRRRRRSSLGFGRTGYGWDIQLTEFALSPSREEYFRVCPVKSKFHMMTDAENVNKLSAADGAAETEKGTIYK